LSLICWAAVLTGVDDPLAAQPGWRRSSGVIAGSIHLPRDSTTVPPMIHVTLNTMAGNFVARVTLSDSLVFRFHNVSNGNYLVRVEAPGHQPAETVIEVASYIQREETFVVLTLGPPLKDREAGLPPSGQPTISAGELAVPDEARRHLERARRESERNNPQGAVRHLRNAVAAYPPFPEAYNSLAIEYLRLGKPKEAKAALERSIELNPDVAVSHRNLAQILLSEERPDEAIASLRRSLELEEENGRSLMLLGEAHLSKNRHGEAVDFFEKASRISPEDHSHLGLARCYLALGRPGEALEELRGFLELEPKGDRAESVRRLVAHLESELEPLNP
jgi:Flp pilus assembly protein TadD